MSGLLAWKGRTEIPARERDELAGIGVSVLVRLGEVKQRRPRR
jgi:hypothetical protein